MADAKEEKLSRSDCKEILRESKQLLKRGGDALEQSVREQIEAGQVALKAALDAKKQDEAEPAGRSLEALLDKHLAGVRKGKAREYGESIVIAVLIALLLRAFAIEAFQIPTSSMDPTLLEGDHLFVAKFAYGVRVPFTTNYLIRWNHVERGDIIVFVFPSEEVRTQVNIGSLAQRVEQYRRAHGEYPDALDDLSGSSSVAPIPSEHLEDGWGQEISYFSDGMSFELISSGDDGEFGTVDDLNNLNTAFPRGFDTCLDVDSLESSKDYIKRVVGLPGDRIRMENNVLYVNDERVDYGDEELVEGDRTRWFRRETFDNGREHTVAHTRSNPDFEEIVVRENHVFVMGDNRDNSSDGRCWGQVPMDNIKGTAMFIFFSTEGGFAGIRWDRIFDRIR